jgi:pilus assembly protein CpaC
VNAEALVNALAREGVMTSLAEPNLMTLSGETASFLAGGEVPIPVPQAYNETTIDYKTFGVALSFTPVVLPDDRIAMRVKPEVSEISNSNAVTLNNFQVPSFITRRAETNVEMASGQTLAIAGLFQRRLQDDIDRVPGIGDLPILGALFRSTRFQRDETELVILITPYLAQPASSPNAQLPTDDVSLRRRPGSGIGFAVH